MPLNQPASVPKDKEPTQHRTEASGFPWSPVVLRALLAAVILGVGVATYAEFGAGRMPWMTPAITDRLTDAEQAQRAAAFSALPPLRVEVVEAARVRAAIDGMDLPPASKQALLADLQPQPGASALPGPAPVAQAGVPAAPLRLAWITLWDTDVQDGDVVRIDSGGYSRTVTLTKRGETFAVPIPAGGLVTISGIKDGDGGGITVGLASGANKAIFPIMSVGQSLGLRVTLE